MIKKLENENDLCLALPEFPLMGATEIGRALLDLAGNPADRKRVRVILPVSKEAQAHYAAVIAKMCADDEVWSHMPPRAYLLEPQQRLAEKNGRCYENV